MAIRQIRVIGDEILNKECKPVKEMTDRTRELIEDMFETMYEANGVGLAAPQVGILKQIIVMDVDDGNQYVLINPEIIEERVFSPGDAVSQTHALPACLPYVEHSDCGKRGGTACTDHGFDRYGGAEAFWGSDDRDRTSSGSGLQS